MSKVKSPPEKKRLAYDRDHATLVEYPHAFRKTWPRKKANAQRVARRKVRQVLSETGDDGPVAEIRRESVGKSASTLREKVQFKKEKRKAMIGAHKARKSRRAGS